MPKSSCESYLYVNMLKFALDQMPKMSGKQIGLLMEMLFASYQLGRNLASTLAKAEAAQAK